MKEKTYYETDHVWIERQDYWSLFPVVIFRKEERPSAEYKGYYIHLGFLCYSLEFMW